MEHSEKSIHLRYVEIYIVVSETSTTDGSMENLTIPARAEYNGTIYSSVCSFYI